MGLRGVEEKHAGLLQTFCRQHNEKRGHVLTLKTGERPCDGVAIELGRQNVGWLARRRGTSKDPNEYSSSKSWFKKKSSVPEPFFCQKKAFLSVTEQRKPLPYSLTTDFYQNRFQFSSLLLAETDQSLANQNLFLLFFFLAFYFCSRLVSLSLLFFLVLSFPPRTNP